MANPTWCLSSEQTKAEREAAVAELKGKIEYIHSQTSETSWEGLVEPLELDTFSGRRQFLKKPQFATQGNWWQAPPLYNASGVRIDLAPWEELRGKIESFNSEAFMAKLKSNYAQVTYDSDYTAVFNSDDIGGAEELRNSFYELKAELENFINNPEKYNNSQPINASFEKVQEAYNNLSFPRESQYTANSFGAPGGFSDRVFGNQKETLKNIDSFIESKKLEDFCPTEEELVQYYNTAVARLGDISIGHLEQAFLDSAINNKTAQQALGDSLIRAGQGSKVRQTDKEKALQKGLQASRADEVIYQEQCFLLANIADLVKMKKAIETPLGLPYTLDLQTVMDSNPNDVNAQMDMIDTSQQNHPIHIQGNAFAFVNKLAVSPDQKQLFELTPAELSSLTPRMRFFKVESGPDGKDIEQEIKFDSNSGEDFKKYFSRTKTQTGGRGLGVGVKSFNFSYDGTDPFSAKKAISAKLSIYAPSFSDLLRERTGSNINYRYVDLALKTGNYKTSDQKAAEANIETLDQIERENLDKLNFRLKVLVEWTASKSETRILSSVKKTALYNSAISIYLTPTIHEFDFDDAGAVTFSINYLAYIEDYFSQPSFDIFASLTADKKVRDLSYSYFRQADCDYNGDDFASFREQDEIYISNKNSDALQTIVNTLRNSNSIFNLSITKKQMREWLKNPWDNTSYINTTKITTNTTIDSQIVSEAKTQANKPEDVDKSLYQLSLISNSDLIENTAFFYLSDLIDAAMLNIENSFNTEQPATSTSYFEEVIEGTTDLGTNIKDYIEKNQKNSKKSELEQFKKMRIVLGPMEVVPQAKSLYQERAISCTIGDIPISLTYFLDFMAEKVLSKDFIQYPFSKFIKDIINDCIRNFINADGCFNFNASQKVSLNSTTVLAYNLLEGAAEDDLSNLILFDKGRYSDKNCLILDRVPDTEFPILKVSGPRGDERKILDINSMRNYFIFTIGKRYPSDLYIGDKNLDSKNGIFHYVLGENKGIVKNISLDKTTTPGLKELRFEQEGFDGLEQLREVYNANITTFLNPQTFPGTYIYVEPKGFDPTATEDLSRYGIGGYYMITKTSHEITPGNSETTLNASWVASKNGTGINEEGGKKTRSEEGSGNSVLKCKSNAVSQSGTTRS